MNGHCVICGQPFIRGESIISNGEGYDAHERCSVCASCGGVLGSSVYIHKKPDGLLRVICLECSKNGRAQA